MPEDLTHRSEFLYSVIKKYAFFDDTILEVGCGDGRNVEYLKKHGFINVTGIDKSLGTAIEDVPLEMYDIIFTMSTLFLIKDESVFEKIAKMVDQFIITIEGETTKGEVIGRDYQKVFEPLGFRQVRHQDKVFNDFGVLRVFEKI